jgi:hypothetical protein
MKTNYNINIINVKLNMVIMCRRDTHIIWFLKTENNLNSLILND